MGTKTGIAWTDSTWNPIRGCSLVSAGCKHCYAMKVAHRYSGPGLPYEGLTDNGKWNGTIRVVPEHMDQPLRWGTQRRIFVNSMSDLFHSNVEQKTIDDIFAIMAMATHHQFQVLTKRPQNMVNYFKEGAQERIADAVIVNWGLKYMRTGPFAKDAEGHRLPTPTATGVAEGIRNGWRWPLPNVWLGVSVEDQETADARVPLLLQTPTKVRWISYEPALGPVDFTHAVHNGECGSRACAKGRVDWVVVGGESGSGARTFDIEWARKARDQCKAAGVAFFMKQFGAMPTDNGQASDALLDQLAREQRRYKLARLRDRAGADPAEWPEDLRVREYPNGGRP